MSPIDLMAQATQRALDDCGLELSDIDGIFSATTQARSPTLYLREYLGIPPKFADHTISAARRSNCMWSTRTRRSRPACATSR